MTTNSVYIGAEALITPLGHTVSSNWQALLAGQSGIKKWAERGWNKADVYLSAFQNKRVPTFTDLVIQALTATVEQLNTASVVHSKRTLVIISSTKGDVSGDLTQTFQPTVALIKEQFELHHTPIVLSNACVSGIMAINRGADAVRAGLYDCVIIIGCDVISDFVLYGFQSLFAVSDTPCRPFDAHRNGVTLGEGVAAVVLSSNTAIFKETPVLHAGGSSSNDANHISGPSRTGEGLYRSVSRTLQQANVSASSIDFVSAHGTGTLYNDEMEAIAFQRLGLENTPMNSMKGYFGHTLGAAGVIETVISMQSLKEQILLKSIGFEEIGTSVPLALIENTGSNKVNTVLKTGSGFGGCNASLLLQRV